jgi:hypothetical protein
MTDAVSDALDWALDRLNGKLPFLDHLARRYLRRNSAASAGSCAGL